MFGVHNSFYLKVIHKYRYYNCTSGTSLDYTSYLTGSKVLDKVSNAVGVESSGLVESIEVTRDSNNTYNYNIKATTNNPKLSYRVVKNVVNEFKNSMMSELNLSSVTK